MKREIAVIGIVIGIALGFIVGFFIPGLLAPATTPGKTLVEEIQDRGELIVGTDAPWPPFELFNTTTSTWEGFDIDLSQMVADELGVTLIVTNIAFDDLIGACKAGTIDMIAAAMMVRHSRALELAHSVTYIRVNEVIVTKGASTLNITSLDDLTTSVVGVQAGTTQYDALSDIAGFTEGVNLLVYPKADTLMLNLDNGVIDAAFVDEPVVSVWSKTYSLKIIFTVPAEPMALWSRWDEPELMLVINKVILEAYRDGVMDDLYEKWFG
ncbi:hypothetical protein LCGC14_1281830 [marine sediment metagenome]|uniref:Solute-binding protein family 3/N-terminal domain-containing protein n=1 Tax=marine sediment metagenome TaxID=412755 RepID=A0A0F9KUZ8_9ZZZZ